MTFSAIRVAALGAVVLTIAVAFGATALVLGGAVLLGGAAALAGGAIRLEPSLVPVRVRPSRRARRP